ncbi:MAG: hypothetical protein ACK42C_00125 [Aquificaceae bacterium]
MNSYSTTLTITVSVPVSVSVWEDRAEAEVSLSVDEILREVKSLLEDDLGTEVEVYFD